MENTWYDDNADGTSYRGYGLIADMGPFLYPSAWPLMAPAILDGTYGDVSFYLVLPNPADPDNPLVAGDGSYPTDVFFAYRYWNYYNHAETTEIYYSDRVPYVPGGGDVTDFVPGMHLYVAIDWDPSYDGPPAYEPDYYVPAGYASYGSAGFETVPGQWSDWQPGPVIEHAAVPSEHNGGNDWYGQGYRSADAPGPGAYSLTYPVPGIATWDAVGGPASGEAVDSQSHAGSAGAQWWRVTAQGNDFKVITPKDYTEGGENHGLEPAYTQSRAAGVGFGERVLAFFARTDLDGVGGDLVYGTDYGTNPTPGDGYQSIEHQPGQIPVPEWLGCPNPYRMAGVEGGSAGWIYPGPNSGPETESLSGVESRIDCYLRLPGSGDFDDVFTSSTTTRPSPGPSPSSDWVLASAGHEFYNLNSAGVDMFSTWEGGSAHAAGESFGIQVTRDVLPLDGLCPPGTPAITLVWATAWLLGQDLSRAFLTAGDPSNVGILFTGNGTSENLEVSPGGEPTRLLGDFINVWTETSPQPYRYTVGSAFLDEFPDSPSYGAYINYRGPPYLAHNPQWRYWTPDHIEPVIQGDQTYMRLAQRADGGGVAPIRRLAASGSVGSQPRSQQADATRRLTLDHNTFY